MSQTKAQLVQPVGVFTGTGINVTGVITATSFVGSGEGLTGVASTDNIITGTAATFNNTVQVNSTLTANSGFTTNATNTQLKVTGITTLSDDVTFTGAAANVTWDKSADDLIFNDNAAAKFGTGNDLNIYHDGSNSYIRDEGTGNLNIDSTAGVVKLRTNSTENSVLCNIDGSVELYYDNTQRIVTTGVGASCVGIMSATSFVGDGSSLTGVGESIAPWYHNPSIGNTGTAVATGIGITFNKKVLAGSGTATLKIVNAGAAGTTVQSWGVSSCTFATTVFSLGALVTSLDRGNTYQIDIPATFIDDSAGKSYVGTAWTFSTSSTAPGDPLFNATAWSWGNNDNGSLGHNNTTNYSSPKQVPGTNWGLLARTTYYARHMAAVKNDNTLWLVGDNDNGQLGQNSETQYSSPVQVPGVNWSSAACGQNTTLAMKNDGTLWAWGQNTSGNLGQNSRTAYSSPVQVGTSDDWQYKNGGYVALGAYQSFAIKTDGTLWMWGNNSSGELGLNSIVQYSSPVQVTTASNWKYGSCDVEKTSAINEDNELFVWGKNQHGQLGTLNNDKIYRSSPIQVPGTWASYAFGDDQGMGIKTDGTLWTFGNNSSGQLGVSDRTQRSSPIQVPGTNWSTSKYACSQATSAAIAMKSDGTVWVWGWNGSGQLGMNNNTLYSSPVQMHGSFDDVVQVDMGNYGWLLRE